MTDSSHGRELVVGGRFTDGKPRKATPKSCKLRWGGGLSGQYFRCGLCGHKFKVGDVWRFLFTNDMPKSGGNPLVCESCDDPDNAVVRAKWAAKCEEWRSDSWWYFRRHND